MQLLAPKKTEFSPTLLVVLCTASTFLRPKGWVSLSASLTCPSPINQPKSSGFTGRLRFGVSPHLAIEVHHHHGLVKTCTWSDELWNAFLTFPRKIRNLENTERPAHRRPSRRSPPRLNTCAAMSVWHSMPGMPGARGIAVGCSLCVSCTVQRWFRAGPFHRTGRPAARRARSARRGLCPGRESFWRHVRGRSGQVDAVYMYILT